MSATELMDPKMDLGMDRVHIVPTKERLEKEQIKLNLSLIETIRVMDMVLGYEILHFFQGTSYAQTLNTCFYAQKEVLAKLQEQFYAGSRQNQKKHQIMILKTTRTIIIIVKMMVQTQRLH